MFLAFYQYGKILIIKIYYTLSHLYFSLKKIRLIVTFSIERCIVVAFPLKREFTCNKKMNKFCIGIIITFAFILYSFSLITSGIEKVGSKFTCVTYEKCFDFVKKAVFIDTAITTFVPFIIIAI